MGKIAPEPHLPPLHRPSVLPKRQPKRRRAAADGPVLDSHLAKHLDLSRQRVRQLVDGHVIARLPNGRFDQDDCRVRHLRWLRDPERRSARTQADTDFVRAKTELIEIRVREKKRALIELEYAKAVMDKAIATVLMAIGGMAARIAGSDLQLRRKIDQILFETRVQLANQFNEFAN